MATNHYTGILCYNNKILFQENHMDFDALQAILLVELHDNFSNAQAIIIDNILGVQINSYQRTTCYD